MNVIVNGINKHKILIIAPHPDDEVIGCGGYIARMKELGHKIYIMFLTVGDTKDFSSNGFSSKSERLKEIERVAEFLDYDDYHMAFGSNNHHLRMDHYAQLDLITMIEKKSPVSLEKLKPSVVLFPNATNYNQDHRAAATAAFAACRPASGSHKHQPEMVFSYEVAADQWNLEKLFSPNFFVKLGNKHITKKVEALRLYASQWRKKANPRSPKALEGLAALRGGQSGLHLAEAFYCYRLIT